MKKLADISAFENLGNFNALSNPTMGVFNEKYDAWTSPVIEFVVVRLGTNEFEIQKRVEGEKPQVLEKCKDGQEAISIIREKYLK